jgi:hypothetical protein
VSKNGHRGATRAAFKCLDFPCKFRELQYASHHSYFNNHFKFLFKQLWQKNGTYYGELQFQCRAKTFLFAQNRKNRKKTGKTEPKPDKTF